MSVDDTAEAQALLAAVADSSELPGPWANYVTIKLDRDLWDRIRAGYGSD